MPGIKVITVQQPLKTIFNRKDLFEIDNDKLMKIKQELQSKYVFTVEYRKGSNHGVPDALSRNPVNDPDKDECSEIKFGHIAAITESSGIQNLSLAKMEEEAKKDERYKILHDAVLSGFQDYKNKYGAWTKPPKFQYVKEFKPHCNNLSTEGALVVWKSRIFVPEELRL